MTNRTVTTVIDASAEDVFSFLSDVDNLPIWATDFARELKYVDGRAKVVNGLGEFFFEIRSDPETGVIDMLAGPTEDALLCFPTRVVTTPAGGSAFTFTMFQAPGQPAEQFDTQYASLRRELDNLGRRFGRAA